MVIANGLLPAKVLHVRLRPKKHVLQHDVYYLALPLSQLDQLHKLKNLSCNRLNWFSLYNRDYGFGQPQPLGGWVKAAIKQHAPQLPYQDILLITMPRVLGYVFNPVSFWCFLDETQQLRAVIAEVNNTFGGRHAYLCMHPDGRAIQPDDWLEKEKVFHVSPFFTVQGHYRFRFNIAPQSIGIWIDYDDGNGKVLHTSVSGKRIDLTTRNLWRCFWRTPLLTLQVIALIHYHAIRLIFKGIRMPPKPKDPEMELS